MRRGILDVSIVMGVLMATATSAGATPIIDQDFSVLPPSLGSGLSSTGDTFFGQSFTVGRTGLLTGADLLVFDASPWFGLNPPTASDVLVQIRTMLAGLPSETVLTAGVIPAAMLSVDPQGVFSHVDFATQISVVPGEVLALSITGIADGWYGHVGSQATYAGGQAFDRGHTGSPWVPFTSVDPGGRPGDYLFRTYVDPTTAPEPSTFLLTLCAAGAFARSRRAQVS